jgi:ATPase family associated with various cellular activities (AAA)
VNGRGSHRSRREGTLLERIESVRGYIARYAGRDDDDAPIPRPTARMNDGDESPLGILEQEFGLTDFESDLIVLCAAAELDSSMSDLCAAAHGDPSRRWPTFGLALAALPNADWRALSPARPLRLWMLLDVERGHGLANGHLRLAERVLLFLLGEQYLDPQLSSVFDQARIFSPADLPPSQQQVARRLVAVWSEAVHELPVMQLLGATQAERRVIAAAACGAVGQRLWVAAAESIPTAAAELDAIIRLWEREAALASSSLLIETEELELDPVREAAVARLLDRTGGVLLVSGTKCLPRQRSVVPIEVGQPDFAERRELWRAALGEAIHNGGGDIVIEPLAAQFAFGALDIRTVAGTVLAETAAEPVRPAPLDLRERLWDACRERVRPRMDGLARRIEPRATFADVVLPQALTETLRSIVAGQRQRAKVFEQWGFSSSSERGRGMTALFAGPSGTGKTMAAEVVAHELRLDLYAVDLSSVVSKYIGETEKNLRRLFDAADIGGSVLLFDEADALFGKRSEVRDSHDRYANMEINYLLQRMESYQGIAILTTNLKSSLDSAFTRRLRYIVEFPFPAAEQRSAIWRRVFPPGVPTAGLDYLKLGNLNVAGGHIRNIAVTSAFAAADEESAVTMRHLLRAARSEYAKTGRTPGESEVGGWE